MIIPTRRSLLIGAGASLLAAPAIVRAASLMPIKQTVEWITLDTGTFPNRELTNLVIAYLKELQELVSIPDWFLPVPSYLQQVSRELDPWGLPMGAGHDVALAEVVHHDVALGNQPERHAGDVDFPARLLGRVAGQNIGPVAHALQLDAGGQA
jgi:hypothetical protein